MKIAVADPSVADGIEGFDLVLAPGGNLNTGADEFSKRYGDLTTLEIDLLTLAAAVFVSDLACKRGEREDTIRTIHLTVPVVNQAILNAQRKNLEYLLHVLSDDNWNIDFQRAEGNPESKTVWPESSGTTLLFSGGLDSFCGAVDLIESEGSDNILLSSHITHNNTTINAQRELCKLLSARYGKEIDRVELRTGPMKSEDFEKPTDNPEVSQRTRSFMFLTIAALSARRTGRSKVVFIAENGQMAIHVPLSAARIGSFSTRTAHPEFVAEASNFFSSVLDFGLNIENPYLYRTKAEVVENVAKTMANAVPITNSCWKSARVSDHCGICVPCLIRRIALETHGIEDTSCWKRNLLAESLQDLPFSDDGKRNLSELAMFVAAFSSMSDAEIDTEYSDVLSQFFDRDEAVAMYRRFAVEALAVLGNYPNLAHLIQ